MSERLLAHGFVVTVWNRSPEKTTPLIEQGASVAGSIKGLAAISDIVFTMVTGSDDVLDVICGPHGLLQADVHPAVVVDCSTISEKASAQTRSACSAAGVEFLAAPIIGDPTMVRDGVAAIACSGPDDTFHRVQRHLEVIAPTVVHAGEGEEARLLKLCSNLVLGMFGQALAEVTALADKGGIAPAIFVEFLNGSVVGSTYVRQKGKLLAEGTGMADIAKTALRRDFDTCLLAADGVHQPMPFARLVRELI